MNDTEKYKLIFEHFKQMENRYHTCMNYYSLFNGALLVAYCTILVSVGKIVEKSSYATSMEGNANGRELFSLDCTYWGFLVLIAALGCVASICWLRSMQGHTAWLDSWRNALRDTGYEFDRTIYVDANKYSEVSADKDVIKKMELYSTAKITTIFIGGVIVVWLLAGVYAIFDGFSFINSGEKLDWIFGLSKIGIFGLIVGFGIYWLSPKKSKSDMEGFELKRVSPLKSIPIPSLRKEIINVVDSIIKLLESHIK